MIFTPLTPFKIEALDGSLLPMGHNRPEGIHQSQIIRLKKEAAGEKVTGIEGEDPDLRTTIGFLWERAVNMVWQGVPWRDALEIVWKEYCSVAKIGPPDRGDVETQLRVESDGVLMTPDGLAWTTVPGTVGSGYRIEPLRTESYKLTWRSLRKWEEDAASAAAGIPPQHFWSWHDAEMGYLRALSKLHQVELRTCRFFIFWTQGDYSRKPGRGPQATFTDVTYTSDEIEAAWESTLRYKKYLEGK